MVVRHRQYFGAVHRPRYLRRVSVHHRAFRVRRGRPRLADGGVAAAPLGGTSLKRVPARPMMIMVGLVLTLTSLFGLWSAGAVAIIG